MREIPVDQLTEGVRFTAPVYMDGESLFVPANVPVRERDIRRLQKWGISKVLTTGHIVTEQSESEESRQDVASAATPSSQSSRFLNAVFETEEYRKVLSTYASLRKRLEDIHQRVKNREPVDTTIIDSIIDRLFQELRSRKNHVVQYVLYGLQGEAGFAENALNSAILSILIAQNAGMVQHKILELATGALFHDVGMLRLPDEIVKKKGKLTKEEVQRIRTHPIHSYKIISRELKYPEEPGQTALQHQERWDGKGYPKGLSGTKIIYPARIVAVADAFEAMVSRRPYRDPMTGYTAIRTILGDNGRRFDPDVLKVFIRTMGIYPLGSVVLLNNAGIGRVVDIHPDAPLRPTVRIMIDETGTEYPRDNGELVDLSTQKKLFVARAVDPRELRDTADHAHG